MRRSVPVTALLLIAALLVVSTSEVTTVSGLIESDSLQTGPYVDEVVFKVIANQLEECLLSKPVRLRWTLDFFDPVYLQEFEVDPDISIFQGIRNGYGHITINCAKYPLNISGLRRAFALAFDKTRVTAEHMDGFSIEHDSLVPLPNGWCAEDQFDWHYYTAQPGAGNQILDDLSFEINETSGFRSAPDGSPFEIIIEYASAGINYLPYIGVDALESLHINANARAADFNEYMSRLDNHGDYDMVVYSVNFYDNDVDWLAYDYWSEYADVYNENPSNFRNSTYDDWRDQLLYGTTYEEVYEAAAEMQKILQYNVPRLVVYENTYMQAYRNDQFTGHIEDLGKYISGPWTLRNIHKLDGSFGGSVNVALAQEPDTFNIFATDSPYSEAILAILWPSLYQYGPNIEPISDLAQNMLTETHSDNPDVPDGHTRFTIEIIQNATWSDGEALTAEDVAFSITYAFESAIYDNPAGADIGDLTAAYAPTPYRVVIEFNTETYWHFSNFAYDYIIPEHIFNDDTGIGYQGWELWNPVFDPTEPNVNCGPFTFTEFEHGEYYTISRNPIFHYAPVNDNTVTSSVTNTTTSTTYTTTTTTSGTNQSTVPMIEWSLTVSTVVGGFSSIIILYCGVQILQKRRGLMTD